MTTLLVSSSEHDHAMLRAIFSRSNWRVKSAFSPGEALALIRSEQIPVVICVEHSPHETWKVLLEQAAHMPNFPRIIVSSRLADDHFWAEVLQAGAYDLLAMPWEGREVLKLNSLAWHSWAFAQRASHVQGKPMMTAGTLALAAAVGS
jgi:DNA-binding response OmpR family regulator